MYLSSLRHVVESCLGLHIIFLFDLMRTPIVSFLFDSTNLTYFIYITQILLISEFFAMYYSILNQSSKQ